MDVYEKRIFGLALIASIVLVVSISSVAISLTSVSMSFPNSGTVIGVGVGIYWDSACTNRTTGLNWGAIYPGSNKTLTIYVRNEGNTATILTKTVKNWVPTTATNYMRLTWNYTSQSIGVNKVLPVNLMLSVWSNCTAITSFSYEFVITASG